MATKKEMFALVRTLLADNADVVAFCDHEMALLSQKAVKKPTKAQMENVGFKTDIFATLTEVGSAMSISDIMDATPSLAGLSNQRVSALITQLKNDGKVVRSEQKGKAFFLAVLSE